jgi:hypothetical protein
VFPDLVPIRTKANSLGLSLHVRALGDVRYWWHLADLMDRATMSATEALADIGNSKQIFLTGKP